MASGPFSRRERFHVHLRPRASRAVNPVPIATALIAGIDISLGEAPIELAIH